jgi:lipoprotein NlpD
MDIGGKEGQAIIATAGGEVVYSGSGLIGYGELIIIKHNESLLSAYAHNRKRLVSEGQKVKAGERIAEMGRNDRNQAMLHFEIRLNGNPQDPRRYLP